MSEFPRKDLIKYVNKSIVNSFGEITRFWQELNDCILYCLQTYLFKALQNAEVSFPPQTDDSKYLLKSHFRICE